VPRVNPNQGYIIGNLTLRAINSNVQFYFEGVGGKGGGDEGPDCYKYTVLPFVPLFTELLHNLAN